MRQLFSLRESGACAIERWNKVGPLFVQAGSPSGSSQSQTQINNFARVPPSLEIRRLTSTPVDSRRDMQSSSDAKKRETIKKVNSFEAIATGIPKHLFSRLIIFFSSFPGEKGFLTFPFLRIMEISGILFLLAEQVVSHFACNTRNSFKVGFAVADQCYVC